MKKEKITTVYPHSRLVIIANNVTPLSLFRAGLAGSNRKYEKLPGTMDQSEDENRDLESL